MSNVLNFSSLSHYDEKLKDEYLNKYTDTSEDEIMDMFAGLFDENGHQTKSWSQLIADGDITATPLSQTVKNKIQFCVNNKNLTGIFVFPYNIAEISVQSDSNHVSLFSNCANLTSILHLPYINDINNASSLFKNMTNLHAIELPNGITKIPHSSFENSGLRFILLPNTITDLTNMVFSNCTELLSVSLPEQITELGPSTFKNDSKLKEILIPNNVTTIGTQCFYNCTSLENVLFSSSLTTINSQAFAGCESLKTLHLPKSLISIDSGAFESCTSLTNISIPENVTTIGNSCFSDNINLQKVKIYGATELKASVFMGCTNLTALYLSKNITTIGSNCVPGNSTFQVFYEGSEEDKANMTINSQNYGLLHASTWHYNISF